jgi:acetyl-CoA C-acetyltransferase
MTESLPLSVRTPVIVGVGQCAERIDDVDYKGLSPVDLAASAAVRAIVDTDADERAVVAAIDTIAATRQFENSSPRAQAPLGRSSKFPLSVANRLAAAPERAVLEVAGGQSPQHLVSDFAREIHAGSADVVLLVGAEAISTVRHLSKQDNRPNFADDPDDPRHVFEDRGFGLKGLVSLEQAAHGLTGAPAQYALLENARRAARRESRDDYAEAMAALFAPFTAVAAANPFAAAREIRSAADLLTVDERNRLIAEPYPRSLVSRDQVNQAAAVIMMSVSKAKSMGIDESKWVYLHGQADLSEPPLLARPRLGDAPSAVMAVEHALSVAGVTIDDIDFFDFYSCFPIAVSNITAALGLAPDDPRGLTLTGGLPYFGGAGNNYSMHAIAEAVARVRSRPDSLALVSANGGVLSKTSVGIYGCAATPFHRDDSEELQAQIDAADKPGCEAHPRGWATIETYTVQHTRSGKIGTVIGRLESNDARFVAQVPAEDPSLLSLLQNAAEPIGQRIWVTPLGIGNRVTADKKTADRVFPEIRPSWRDEYEYVTVTRNGYLVEITINRPDARNALHPPAHEELASAFDAFFADSEVRVAIITGAGTDAFCAGNDLVYGASGKPMYLPLSGFAGITSRRGMTKPVIAAVNGSAMGGGFEIALACHLVVADESAQFALSEVKVGLIAGAGGLMRLPRVMPRNIANELILTGRRIVADEAERLGVVNRVAPQGKALEVARDLAADILDGSPTSVRLSLTAMERAAVTADVFDAVRLPDDVRDELMASADASEGMAAFAEKRKPHWSNR